MVSFSELQRLGQLGADGRNLAQNKARAAVITASAVTTETLQNRIVFAFARLGI